jgi:hypothetical protein
VKNAFRNSHATLLTWLFILMVAAADVGFFWMGRDSAKDWELNPVALAALRYAGMGGLILYRGGWVAFEWLMACTRVRLSWIITPVWGLAHLYLLILLIHAVPHLLEAVAVRAGLGPEPISAHSHSTCPMPAARPPLHRAPSGISLAGKSRPLPHSSIP